MPSWELPAKRMTASEILDTLPALPLRAGVTIDSLMFVYPMGRAPTNEPPQFFRDGFLKVASARALLTGTYPFTISMSNADDYSQVP
jgi:hypothetical protein